MKRRTDPPRLARRLLALALPCDAREEICGDLEEVFRRRCASHGVRRARIWYAREAVLFSGRFLWERVRDGAVRRPGGGHPKESSLLHRTPQGGLAGGCPSWLDFKLGLRMLVKQPGLTVVGGLAMAVAMGTGAAWFDLQNDFFRRTLPLDEGDRIVGIKNWDIAAGAPELRSLHDFVEWREDAESVVDLSAFTRFERNLITADGQARVVEGAAISSSAFRLVRVPPLLGRPLVETDEQEEGPPVVVLGYEVWRDRFAEDPDVVGRVVELGATPHTIVGVMPEGFTFPVRHDLWVPLRINTSRYERRQGPELWMFARLAAGANLQQAQVELTTLGSRAAADHPSTHENLRPRVVPYTQLFSDIRAGTSYAIHSVFIMLLALVCANVGTLVFARAATREDEIVVRNALGASRGRIVVQLFIETLVLASLAAVIGLAAATWAQRWLTVSVAGIGMPFWTNPQLSPATVLYVAGLTALCATIAGVAPALKATGPRVAARLRRAAVGGSGPRFGGLWNGVIVAQVALIVAILPGAISLGWEAVRYESLQLGFPAEDYLSVGLDMEREPQQSNSAEAGSSSRFRSAYHELKRRLLAEPGVMRVTFANRAPGMGHLPRQIEVDGIPPTQASSPAQEVSTASIAPDFFEVMGASILSGRGFNSGDAKPGHRTVVVNQSFVRHILGDRNPLGVRVRYTEVAEEKPAPWYEIVGVVTDLSTDPHHPRAGARLYHSLTSDRAAPGVAHAVVMVVRRAWEFELFASRLRSVAAEVDPAVRVRGFRTIDELLSRAQRERRLLVSLITFGMAVAVLLSATGIYSLVSFTVSRRTREIGVRAALGARPGRIIAAILSRVLAQIGIGVAAGGVIVASVGVFGSEGSLSGDRVMVLLTAAAIMMMVGLLACALPARRALRIAPTEALKDG